MVSKRIKYSKYQEEKYKTETLDRDKIREKVLHDINLPQYDRKDDEPYQMFKDRDHLKIWNNPESEAAAKLKKQNMTPFERLEEKAT